jgi:dipeptidyl aminopeptidase/acylaminoacyl peptidase
MNYLRTLGAALAITLCLAGCKSEMKKEAGKYIGPSDIKVEDGRMTPEVLLSLGRLSDPQLSPDGKTILFGVSYTSIPDNRSVRNLFLCNVDGTGRLQLTRSGKSISNARFTPDGNHIFFLKGGQMYKAQMLGKKLGKPVKVSDVEGGISEFALSPDGSQVMYVSTVHSAVERPSDTDPALDKAQAYATEDLMYRHWDHWVEEIPHTYVAPVPGRVVTKDNSLDILGGDDVKFELPTEPFGGIEQLAWSPDSRYIAYSCRKLTGSEYAFSTDTEIYIYCPLTGETTVIPMGGGYDTDPVFSPDGKKIAWLSMARNGYEADKVRLMVADLEYQEEGEGQTANPAVKNIRDITAEFKYNAAGPVWAEDGESIYFNALAEGIQRIYKARVPAGDLTCPVGELSVEPVTSDDLWYDFGSPFGILEDGTLLATYCSMEFPTELVAVKDGVPTRIGDENGHILSQLTPYKTEKRMVKTVDGQDMLTWVLFPPEFDPAKEYPAIEICLGGPQGTLSQGWSYRWNYRLMASQGYVVVLPNRRGTTAFGQPWCEQISGDYIGLNMQDYLAAAKALKAEPYVGKMAACGASYGGYSVYYLAGIHGDVYDCFIAHAGIFNEEHMYMTTEEMWFPNWDNGGIPVEYAFEKGKTGPAGDGITFGGMQQAGSPWSTKPEAVRHYANSPHKLVQNWHTPILCIHGGTDFRVPYDEGMAAFNAAQMMGVPSKLIVFPEENHWILQPQNALYWHRSYFNWLDRWCK